MVAIVLSAEKIAAFAGEPPPECATLSAGFPEYKQKKIAIRTANVAKRPPREERKIRLMGGCVDPGESGYRKGAAPSKAD
jgi:hypothetical protein